MLLEREREREREDGCMARSVDSFCAREHAGCRSILALCSGTGPELREADTETERGRERERERESESERRERERDRGGQGSGSISVSSSLMFQRPRPRGACEMLPMHSGFLVVSWK